MQPDVTFLVAAFNAAGTIERAIDSALRQNTVSAEVVVADDASSDRTPETVAALGDPRVRLVRLPRNLGPGGARNAGLAAARGRYVAILDADDEIRADRMGRLVARLDAEGAAAIVDGIEVRTPDGRTAPMFVRDELRQRSTIGFADFVLGNRLFAGTYNFGYLKPVFRRSFLAEARISYPESLRIGEDYQFLADLLSRGGICLVEPTVGYTYHVTQGSVSRVLTLAHVDAIAEGDREFLSGRHLDAQARDAYRLRRRSIERARSFLTMIDALKHRDAGAFAAAALRDPLALAHFRMPAGRRLGTLLDALRGSRRELSATSVRRPDSGE